MAVSSVSNECVPKFLQLFLNSLGVLEDLLLVLLELGGIDLLEGNGQGGDGVVVGATLMAGEDGEVDWVLEVIHDLLTVLVGASNALAEEDHGSSGSTERLVGSGGNNIGVFKWRWNDTGSNEAGNVSHVDNEIGTNGVGNLPHSGIVDKTAVGRSTGNKTLWSVELSIRLKQVIVNYASLKVDLVWESLKVSGDSRDSINHQMLVFFFSGFSKCSVYNILLSRSLITVTQMAAVWQV